MVEGEWWYYPYGVWRYKWGAPKTSFRYTGQRWDSGTGLYWYRSRWYDPALGRFIQPDTIVPEPGNPQALNRYACANNNPLRYTDPSGHAALSGDDYDDADEYVRFNYFAVAYGPTMKPGRPRTWEESKVDMFVPEEGTVSITANLTGGAGMYGQAEVGFIHIDQEGDVVLGSFGIGGGSMAGTTGSITLSVTTTDAENVNELGAYFTAEGGSTAFGPMAGVDVVQGKSDDGELITGVQYSLGVGADVAPFPGTEAHGGATYTWLSPVRFNLYALTGTKPPRGR